MTTFTQIELENFMWGYIAWYLLPENIATLAFLLQTSNS